MKHILILLSILLLVNTQMKAQPCIAPVDTVDHVFKELIIHGSHDNIFWSGDTLRILLEEIDHVRYDTVAHIQTYYNNPAVDAWIQCRLDTGATPHQILNETNNPESIIHHFYGKTYAGGIIFHMDIYGGGLVANTSDAPSLLDWNAAMAYPNTVSTGGHNDWYLPNRSELNEMYQNLHKKGLGGFASGLYWSSTESNYSYAWYQYFVFGNLDSNSKIGTFNVRAIRAF